MFEWLKRKSLASALSETRRFRLKGVTFEIQKVSVSHFIEGGKVMKQTFDTYKTKDEKRSMSDVSWDKIKSHYSDVILAGVVNPQIARKDGEPGVFIDKIFKDWDMCNQLYEAICAYTYGKKKLVSRDLQEPDL